MQVENTENQHIAAYGPRKITSSDKSDFAVELKNQHIFNEKLSQKIDTLSTTLTTAAESDNLKLGTLSGSNTTVAQLLLAKPELKAKTWSIIHNPINRNKSFHQIPSGKEIFYDQKTQELHWSGSKSSEITNPEVNYTIKPGFSTASIADTTTSQALENEQKIILGHLNQKNPTISDLLAQQSDYKTQRWDIIHSELNQNKAFTKIPNGSTIYIDSRTKELSWNKPAHAPEQSLKIVSPGVDNNLDNNIINNKILATKLDDAVKPFMGTEYKHLDCYTLVVNGLENMGVRYRGRDSLSKQLLQRAQIEGRANNAYFTGEGISEALGNKIYTRAITKVKNIDQQSKDIFQEMQSLMRKGDILSFSLDSRGHTGVISQNKEQWTFINSGRLDNSITSNVPRHGVGEETLLHEINNWIKLAQQRKESLKITVGRLDKQKFV